MKYLKIVCILTLLSFALPLFAAEQFELSFSEYYSKNTIAKINIESVSKSLIKKDVKLKKLGKLEIKALFNEVTINNKTKATWFEIKIEKGGNEIESITGVFPHPMAAGLTAGSVFKIPGSREKLLLTLTKK